jgi:hypothetical protein
MANPTPDDHEGHERRVRKILTQARREVGVRDLVTFAFARMWTVVLAIGATMYALINRWHVSGKDRRNHEGLENDKKKGNP